jgi:hypothetical protein
MEETNLYNIIAPVRIKIEREKWDKMRIACAVIIGGFVLFSGCYFGYWYTTDWQEIKEQKTIGINQTIINGTYCDNGVFCPLYSINNVLYTPKCL